LWIKIQDGQKGNAYDLLNSRVGYVEFFDEEAVINALAMSGSKLCGIPIIVELTESEKNRRAELAASAYKAKAIPTVRFTRLFVTNLHSTISEDSLRKLFEPFGLVDVVAIQRDPDSNRSTGSAFIEFRRPYDAKIAMNDMNGFELMGKFLKVSAITDDRDMPAGLGKGGFHLDDSEAVGIRLNARKRADLMSRLSREPIGAPSKSSKPKGNVPPPPAHKAAAIPMSTRCVLLTNMFDPTLYFLILK
jgi:RNA-binding protein 39